MDRLDRPQDIGTDSEGAVHHFSPYDARVVVVAADGSIEHTTAVAPAALDEWISFVADERGWASLRYRETFVEIAAEAIDA